MVIAFAAAGVKVRVGTADASYYPRVLAVVQNASPAEREHLLLLWASQTPPSPDFVTPLELHGVLWRAGYCTNLFRWPGCNELPAGSESQGIAKEVLNDLSARYRK